MIYFISGHRNLTVEEFKFYYQPKIRRVIRDDPNPHFVVGDCKGADYWAQKFLVELGLKVNTTVYHIGNKPKNLVPGLQCKGGFRDDEERDSAMTMESDFDIAYSRKMGSGTFQNVMRRIRMSGEPGFIEKLFYYLTCKKS